jgi:hypothetical protein
VPVGFVYDTAGRVILDPDRRVQDTIRAFFDMFRRTGSATAVVKTFRDQQLLFPRHARHGLRETGIRWVPLLHARALWILHNPRFAGAYFFGRSRHRRTGETRLVIERLPRDEWTALIPNAHPGYITWEEFEENQRRLRENTAAHGDDRRRSPPREGPALLQPGNLPSRRFPHGNSGLRGIKPNPADQSKRSVRGAGYDVRLVHSRARAREPLRYRSGSGHCERTDGRPDQYPPREWRSLRSFGRE